MNYSLAGQMVFRTKKPDPAGSGFGEEGLISQW